MSTRRIARELHNGAIQKVFTAGLLIRSAEKLAAPETPQASRLAAAVGVLDDAMSKLTPEPQPVAHSGRVAGTLEACHSEAGHRPALQLAGGCGPEAGFAGNPVYLTPERSIQVMAIIQESLANVVRHAHARAGVSR